jgi:hypothetical protein
MFESDLAHHGVHRGHIRPIVPRERHHAARHVTVPGDYVTIQKAVDDKQVDTIQVNSQTYTEQITIRRDVTLIGAGDSTTIIQSPDLLQPDEFGKRFIVEVREGASVNMSGFKIQGPNGNPHWGIGVFDGSTLELSHATVTQIRQSPNLSGGTGILVGLPPWVAEEQVGNAVLSNVNVSGYSNHGICVIGNGSTADIFGNEVIGYGHTRDLIQVGIMVGFGAKAKVTKNHTIHNISDQDGSGPDLINQGQSVGVFAIDADAGTFIYQNRVEGNDVGIYLYESTGLDQTNDNFLTNNRYFGLTIQDSNNTCSGNNITGGNIGIGVVADSVNTVATLQNNRISSGVSVEGISTAGYSASYLSSQ